MPQEISVPSPVPYLRIQYQTDIVRLADPLLYSTISECLDVIAVRQQDFARSLTVTITDTTTNTIVSSLAFKRTDVPLHLPWLMVTMVCVEMLSSLTPL